MTKRQREVVDFIEEFIREANYSPSLEEIAAGRAFTQREVVRVLSGGRDSGNLGAYLSSNPLYTNQFDAGATKHLTALKKQGLVDWDRGIRRSLQLVQRSGLSNLATRDRRLIGCLKEIEHHCPCGARPESPNMHPHVLGCPVGRALRLLPTSQHKVYCHWYDGESCNCGVDFHAAPRATAP